MPISAVVLGDQGGLRAGRLPVLVNDVPGRLAARSALPRLVATSHIEWRKST
jgi:hypothetical protein